MEGAIFILWMDAGGAYVNSRREGNESRVILPDWEAVEVDDGGVVIPSRAHR